MAQLVERLSGTGVVYRKGGDLVGEVRYDLRVYQERLDAPSKGDHATVPGVRRVEGRVTRLDNAALLLERAKLTMRLEDGRPLDFEVRQDGSVIPNSGL